MSAERNTFGAYTLTFFQDSEFVNNFQKVSDGCKTHHHISPYLINTFTTDNIYTSTIWHNFYYYIPYLRYMLCQMADVCVYTYCLFERLLKEMTFTKNIYSLSL
jgi:hypothetical protein